MTKDQLQGKLNQLAKIQSEAFNLGTLLVTQTATLQEEGARLIRVSQEISKIELQIRKNVGWS